MSGLLGSNPIFNRIGDPDWRRRRKPSREMISLTPRVVMVCMSAGSSNGRTMVLGQFQASLVYVELNLGNQLVNILEFFLAPKSCDEFQLDLFAV